MAIPTVRLLAIGDIAWDILVHPAGEFVWGSDVYGSVDLLPGGSSANVAVWARRLGGRATLVGKIGDDRLGDLMQAHLETEQVAAGVTRVAGRPTTRIAIVIRPDGEHAFVTDHTQPLRLTAHDLPFSLLDEADVVFLNGYAVFMAGSAAFASAFLDEARRRRIPVAFDPSSFALVSAYGGARLRRELGALDVLLANEEELRALADDGSQESLFTASRLTVVKQGARGASAWRQGGSGADA
jgi:sugar/nucleoside kinase (ribokinase family)